MNKDLLKKILPHLIAVIVFLAVAVIYCRPALEGKVVLQHDITSWKGAIQKSLEYKTVHGDYPLWISSVFSGMPGFQIGAPSNTFVPGIVHKILTLGLPEPIQFFFLACICFYFLCMVLRLKPVVGILGALAFAYATYNPVIITAGHVTKMWSIAYMPAVLASVLLIYEKKYFTGAALTALFSATMVAMNHLQIVYYLFISIAVITIFFAIRWIQEKQIKHLFIALIVTAIAALTGTLNNAVGLMPTYEYQKYTIRGGASYLTDSTTKKENKTADGLDRNYAFSYSLNIPEPLVMIAPRMYGGSSGMKEIDEDKSKTIEALRSLPAELQQQLPASMYWGGIADIGGSVGTSGPPYIGAIVCFLALLGFFIIDKKYKWGILAAIILAVVLSWGSYFKEVNDIVFNLFPFYNKFRAPSMIMVIPQLLIPVLAVLGMNAIINTEDKKTLWPKFKKGLIATGVLFILLLLTYMSLGYMSSMDNEILKNVRNANQPQLLEAVKSFYDGLKADRKSLFIGDIFRSLGFIALAALMLFLLIRNSIKPVLATALIALFVLIDLLTVDSKYLNKESYQDKADNESVFSKAKADEDILADKSYYRVFNVAGDHFNENITSYLYNSVGGYHAAKLRVYQDLIERQLGNNPNPRVLQMLNTKYLIEKDGNGITKGFQKLETALGPCWLVKNIQFVKNADDEMKALDNFNPKDTAIVHESFKAQIAGLPQLDSVASITSDTLNKNENDKLNYSFNASSNQFAVFSEVYYPAGWKAFIDGKETTIIKTNYALRGLAVPAGKHTIEFRFEPQGYMNGKKITSITSYLLLALFALAGFMAWKRKKAVSQKQ
jgi:hypothetical protein